MLSHKETVSDKIILVENEKVVSDDREIAICFNDYFTDITKSLDIKLQPTSEANEHITDKVLKAIDKYKDHPSVLKIKEQFPQNDSEFKFQQVLPEEVNEQIVKLKTSKSARGNIPLKMIKPECIMRLY